jgi:hypothetical protein
LFLTSVLDKGKPSYLRKGSFTSGKRAFGIPRIGDWFSHNTRLNTLRREKVLATSWIRNRISGFSLRQQVAVENTSSRAL